LETNTSISPLLDFESLLAPIAGDDPAGSSLPYMLREQLDTYRREINPSDYDADDPQRPETAKPAEWPAIIELAQRILRDTAKDLTVGARLTEALVKRNGFVGLRDGLHLLRRMVEECWDRLSPLIEPGDDLEIRSAAFRWLDDPDRGAAFPTTIRSIPLIEGGNARYSWLDWKRSQDPRSGIDLETLNKARQQTPSNLANQNVSLLTEARAEFDALVVGLQVHMGDLAPALLGLRQALDDCQLLAKQVLQLNTGADTPTSSSEEQETAPDVSTTAEDAPLAGSQERTAASAVSRAQIYARISEAAATLRRLEPHSPIPYLLERAVALGSLPFPDLMKELVRDPNVLIEMNREMGIKDPPSSEA